MWYSTTRMNSLALASETTVPVSNQAKPRPRFSTARRPFSR
ncbi:hypothetical protein EVA_10739 [gut metagenome]|uniref:Uncharacterized protein n=1 Tax=gut metagenome TaxID=749906 RepID=J9G1S2_9ZZZZ